MSAHTPRWTCETRPWVANVLCTVHQNVNFVGALSSSIQYPLQLLWSPGDMWFWFHYVVVSVSESRQFTSEKAASVDKMTLAQTDIKH